MCLYTCTIYSSIYNVYLCLQVFGGDDSDDEELPSTGLVSRQVSHYRLMHEHYVHSTLARLERKKDIHIHTHIPNKHTMHTNTYTTRQTNSN